MNAEITVAVQQEQRLTTGMEFQTEESMLLCRPETGAMLVTVDGTAFSLQAGDLLLVPPHSHLLVLSLDGECPAVSCRVTDRGGMVFTKAAVTRHAQAGPLFETLLAARSDHPLRAPAALLQLLDLFEAPQPPMQPEERLERVLAYLDSAEGEHPDIEMLAGIAGLHPNYFIKFFESHTGTSPGRYMIRRRMERAREMLSNSDLSIGEIAQVLGFKDSSYFSRLFKAKEGMTPLAYRRRALGAGSIEKEL